MTLSGFTSRTSKKQKFGMLFARNDTDFPPITTSLVLWHFTTRKLGNFGPEALSVGANTL